MKRFLIFITAVWLCIPSVAWSYDLLIVQSQRSPVYDEVLRGFRSAARYSERVIVLSDYNEIDLIRITREEHPIAIITLGDKALAVARKARQTPVIALMALSYRAGMTGHPSMTGVDVQPSPERYLPIFTSIKSRKVGVIGNTDRSGSYIKHARKAAAGLGIDLVVREVKTSQEVLGQLASLAGIVDSLWMLPDTIASSGEAADAYFLFSAIHKVPVVTFSSVYLASGAALALDTDRYDMGKQGGEMAASLMNGDRVAEISPKPPRKTTLKYNPYILRRLDLKLDFPGSRAVE